MLSIFITTISFNSLAVSEQKLQTLKPYFQDNQKFFKIDSFNNKEQQKISYVKFGTAAGPNGCIVLSPGQGEASLKYLEVAHDLVQQGFSPIYSIDHVGQGASHRFLPDTQKTHIEDFSQHTANFHTFIDYVVMKDKTCNTHPNTNLNKIFLIGHSMGGAIATRYLETIAEYNPFSKTVLSAPMIKILFPNKKSDDSVLFETWLACNTVL